MAIDFDHSTLFISARSPYARRVRVALREHGVPFEEKVVDVFKPQPELNAVNPLARVPTLVLKSGRVMVESHLILQAFYESRTSTLFPRTDEEKLVCFEWSALATGICDKCVDLVMERLRPEAQRDAELFTEIDGIFDRVLPKFEKFISGRKTIRPDRLTQADLDMAVALAYLSLRHSPKWREKYLESARFFDALDARPSFQATRPPAA